MTKWTLFVVLLLPAMMGLKVTHVSINGKEPHLTPLCSNKTIIPLIVCKIRTERWSNGCKLFHRHGHDFESNCSSKVTLKSENQTVYLHLDGLTQEDNGEYDCQCSNTTGTYMVDLSVTVEVSVSAQPKDENSDSQMNIMAMGGAASVIALTLVIFGIICSRRLHRKQQSSPPVMASSSKHPPGKCNEPDGIYEELEEPTKDNYETIVKERRSKIYVNAQSSQGNRKM